MANKFTALKIDVEKATALYKSGMTQAEVAKELGTTQKVIFTRLRKAGVKCRVAAKRNQRGSMNNMWKGDRAGYQAMHCRVETARGTPKSCAMCDTTKAIRYEWANLTGNYANILDYARMCVKCHRRFDRSRSVMRPSFRV